MEGMPSVMFHRVELPGQRMECHSPRMIPITTDVLATVLMVVVVGGGIGVGLASSRSALDRGQL